MRVSPVESRQDERRVADEINRDLLATINQKNQLRGKRLSLVADFLSGPRAVGIFDSEARVKADSSAHLLVLHGLGSAHSHVMSTISYLAIFNERGPGKKKSGKPPSTRYVLKNQFDFELSAEAIALPGSHGGPSLCDFQTIEDFSLWFVSYLLEFKKLYPRKPIYILSRSASAMLAVRSAYEANRSQQRLIEGVVLMSPMLPFDPRFPDWLERGKSDLLGFARYHQMPVDRPMIDWMYDRHREIKLDPVILENLPMLTLVGEMDSEQVPVREREVYQALAEDHPLFEYHEIKGAYHDLLATDRKVFRQKIETLSLIYNFVKKQERRRASGH